MAEYIYGEQVIESHKVGGVTYGTVKPLGERRERVVRCRGCKHWRRPSNRERSRCTGAMAFVEPTPDGFCAWGEPREEE